MSVDTDRRIEELLGELRKANAILEGADGDGARKAAALEAQAGLAGDLSDNDEKRELEASRKEIDRQLDELRDLMAGNRGEGKARAVGGVQPPFATPSRGVFRSTAANLSPAMKAVLADPENYEPGTFLGSVLDAAGLGYDMHFDPFLSQRGKASLEAMGSTRLGVPAQSTGYKAGVIEAKGADPDFSGKATMGMTGATGGYVLPNNLVDGVLKPASQKAVYQNLVTVINGVAVRGVDQPYRTGGPQRASFVNWGVQKPSYDLAYGTYSANLGTIAIIYDIGKQYARFSAGAAEQDVMDEITRGIILGENYYIAVGAGTGTVGTGDPTAGVYTQLVASGLYTTAHAAASNSTIVGSFAKALTEGAAALATRSRESTAWVVDATTFWTAIAQGSNEAGFWVSPTDGPTGFTRTSSGGLAFWGMPVYYDANLGANAATKIAIGGEWDALKLYRGMEFRIDSSDVAGTRWDLNLIGFRGEEEIGFHAGSAVAVGAMQLITAVIP